MSQSHPDRGETSSVFAVLPTRVIEPPELHSLRLLLEVVKSKVAEVSAIKCMLAEIMAELAQARSDPSTAIVEITERALGNFQLMARDQDVQDIEPISAEIHGIADLAEEALLSRTA